MQTNPAGSQPCRTPRLPTVPHERSDALIHGLLAFAAVLAVVQFHAAILQFLPHARPFAARVQATPAILVDGRHGIRPALTNLPGQVSVRPATNTPAISGSDPTRPPTPGAAF